MLLTYFTNNKRYTTSSDITQHFLLSYGSRVILSQHDLERSVLLHLKSLPCVIYCSCPKPMWFYIEMSTPTLGLILLSPNLLWQLLQAQFLNTICSLNVQIGGGGPCASVFGPHNLLKYSKYSALLSRFISNYHLAGFKELLEKKKKKYLCWSSNWKQILYLCSDTL